MQIWEHSVQIGRISIKMTFFCVITRIKLETWNLVNLQIKILQKTFKASRNKIFFASFYCDFNEFFYFFLFLLQYWWFLPRRVYSVCGIVQNFCWKALPIISCSPAKVCVTETYQKTFRGRTRSTSQSFTFLF